MHAHTDQKCLLPQVRRSPQSDIWLASKKSSSKLKALQNRSSHVAKLAFGDLTHLSFTKCFIESVCSKKPTEIDQVLIEAPDSIFQFLLVVIHHIVGSQLSGSTNKMTDLDGKMSEVHFHEYIISIHINIRHYHTLMQCRLFANLQLVIRAGCRNHLPTLRLSTIARAHLPKYFGVHVLE